MDNQEIMHLWDAHVGWPNEKYPLTEGDILRFVGVILSRAIPEGNVVVPGWLPIESIPRDGSTIIVGFGRQSGFPVKIVRWDSLKRMWKHYGEWVPGLEANATHWMPLPAAPSPIERIEHEH